MPKTMGVISREQIRAHARALGFDAVRFARAETSAAAKQQFAAYLSEGRHGDRAWMSDTAARRAERGPSPGSRASALASASISCDAMG